MKTCASYDGIAAKSTTPSNVTALDIGSGAVTSAAVSKRINRFVSVGQPLNGGSAQGNDGQVAYWSDDGVKWNCADWYNDGTGGDQAYMRPPDTTIRLNLPTGLCVCYGNDRFVMAGTGTGGGRYAFHSFDGKTWYANYNIASGPNTGPCFPTNVKKICWTGTMFVAVGGNSGSQVAISTDGITWTDRVQLFPGGGNDSWAYSVVWTGQKIIVVGSTVRVDGAYLIFRSSDGINWEGFYPRVGTWDDPATINTFTAACTNGAITVAAESHGYIAYSTDHGATWTTITPTVPFVMKDICWDGTKFVGVGSSGNMAHSTDGISWTYNKGLLNVCGGATISGICWNGTMFVVAASGVGTYSNYYSYDGSTWIGTLGAPYISSDYYTTYGAFAVCSSVAPNLIPPQTGVPITAEDTMAASSDFSISCWVKPKIKSEYRYVAVGSYASGKRVMWSSDLTTWHLVNDVNGYDYSSVCYGAGVYILTETRGMEYDVCKSTDGCVTIQVAAELRSRYWYNGSWYYYTGARKTIYDGTRFITVGSFDFSEDTYTFTNFAAISTDKGDNWTKGGGTIFDMAGATDICYDGTTYVVVGNGNSSTVATSTNGTTWTDRGQPWSASYSGTIAVLTYGGGKFIAGRALGYDDTGYCMAYSSNSGTAWTIISDPLFYNNQWDYSAQYVSQCYGVCWSGSIFVAVGLFGYSSVDQYDGDWNYLGSAVVPGYSIVKSTNGIDWTGVTTSLTLFGQGTAICWDGTHFVATGNGSQVAVSTNGTDWTVSTPSAGCVRRAIACCPAPTLYPAVPGYTVVSSAPIIATSSSTKYMSIYTSRIDAGFLPNVTIVHDVSKGLKVCNYASKNGALTTDAWHHMVFVKSGVTLSAYIDDALSITATYDPFTGIGGWTLGTDTLGNFGKMNLEEVLIYKGIALNSTEVSHLYNGGVGRFLTN